MMSKRYNIGVAGNPNSGKTSIFNCLTGANLKVGNWPGVTVEKKEGLVVKNTIEYNFIDIPGTYGFSATSIDERIALDFLMNGNPDAVIVVIDSSNFNRNFYLLTMIFEMGIKVIPVLNMGDVADKKGVIINETLLSSFFGIPFVKTVASKKSGISDLWDKLEDIESISLTVKTPSYTSEIESAIDQLTKDFPEQISTRFDALQCLESCFVKNSNGELERSILKFQAGIEHETEDTVENIIAQKRYEFVYSVARECVTVKMSPEDKMELTDKVDSFVTHKFLGFPIFLFAMWLMFYIVYSLGNPLADQIDGFFSFMGNRITGDGLIASFFRDGLIGGVGSLLVFVPNIFILYFVIALMEDSGYLARAAFVADKFMHKLGLHGKSFIPLLIGFGCNIPAIMAVRTLENEKDRVLTGMMIPYMSCSARLPVYLLFAGVFFPSNTSFVIFLMYLTGIVISVFIAKMLRKRYFVNEVTPLIMELPTYHMPVLKYSFRSASLRTWFFVKKAGTFIVGAVLVIWILASLPAGVEYASRESVIGQIGSFIAPVLEPAGFGNWQSTVALIFGFLAKEIVISTFGVLFGGEANLPMVLSTYFNSVSAISFLVMILVYVPCVATIAAMRKEIGTRWATMSVVISIVLGYVLSVLVFQGGKLLGFI